MNRLPSKKDFWFLPLGGSNEIGMNLNLYGYNHQWLMVDLGISFHDRLGIEILTPDTSYIEQHASHLKGIIITHAHEDHVGAVPYLWPRLKAPIYATPFTVRIIKQKLKEHPWGHDVPVFEVPLSGKINIGDFDIEFLNLTHSIPEPNGLIITTPKGKIFHTGDWKFDPEPTLGAKSDFDRLKKLGKEGVLAMVCDSTNVFTEGTSGSEEHVKKNLMDLIGQFPKKRIAVACFASNVARVQTIMHAAALHGRKVALVGRSLKKMVEAALHTGYLHDLPEIIDADDVSRQDPSKILLITTGSQGEPRAALSRIAAKTHPSIKFDENDVAIFSSRIIPGNEKSIGAMQNALVRTGVKVITADGNDIHVSGHPARDELRQMYDLVKPQILIPVHGEARHLEEQKKLAMESGIREVVVPQNGSIVSIDPKDTKIIGDVKTGRLAVDGNRIVPIDSSHLRDRYAMSSHGMLVLTLVISKKNGSWTVAKPLHLTAYGITSEHEELQNIAKDIQRFASHAVKENTEKAITEKLRTDIRRMIKGGFDKRPVIEIHIVQL